MVSVVCLDLQKISICDESTSRPGKYKTRKNVFRSCAYSIWTHRCLLQQIRNSKSFKEYGLQVLSREIYLRDYTQEVWHFLATCFMFFCLDWLHAVGTKDLWSWGNGEQSRNRVEFFPLTSVLHEDLTLRIFLLYASKSLVRSGKSCNYVQGGEYNFPTAVYVIKPVCRGIRFSTGSLASGII
jgi:hypothetical protein